MGLVHLETADLGLPALDALATDALALFVGPERPLQGLAGFADWRLCGRLSRVIREGRYDPDAGEQLLLPSAGRFAVPRIFCFGQPRPAADAAEFAAQARRLCDAMRRAGSAAWAADLPRVADGLELPVGRLFLEALLPAAPRRVVLLGEARALHKALAAARDAMNAAELDLAVPVSRVELPPRGTGLPHPGHVVR